MKGHHRITWRLKDYKEPHNVTVVAILLAITAGVVAIGIQWFHLFEIK
jgi:hypothetical protein